MARKNDRKYRIFLVLDNIRSIYNVGSVFRTADAAGISEIFLCGITPTPIDRFNRARSDLEKVALGAEKNIPWRYFKNTEEAVKNLKKEKVNLIAVEQTKKSIDYKKIRVNKDTAFVFGNEVKGVSESVLKTCDLICEIPMKGKKESLNVSVSVGIILFRALGL